MVFGGAVESELGGFRNIGGLLVYGQHKM